MCHDLHKMQLLTSSSSSSACSTVLSSLYPSHARSFVPASRRNIPAVASVQRCATAVAKAPAAAAGRLQFIEREGQHIGVGKWGGEGGCSLQHLYAVILAIAHDDATLAVDQNAVWTVELPISTAKAADGSHVAAVTVAENLHSMIHAVSYYDVACTVERDAAGIVELTSA